MELSTAEHRATPPSFLSFLCRNAHRHGVCQLQASSSLFPARAAVLWPPHTAQAQSHTDLTFSQQRPDTLECADSAKGEPPMSGVPSRHPPSTLESLKAHEGLGTPWRPPQTWQVPTWHLLNESVFQLSLAGDAIRKGWFPSWLSIRISIWGSPPLQLPTNTSAITNARLEAEGAQTKPPSQLPGTGTNPTSR